MKTKIFYSTFILLIFVCFTSYAQVYRTSWDNATERQGWSQYHLGADSSTSWYYTPVAVLIGEVLAHTAPSLSSTTLMDNWIVSPVFDFSAGGSIDSLYFSLSGVGKPAVGDTLGIYLLSGAQNPALSTNMQLLKQYDSTDYGMPQNTTLTIPATTGNSYLAFRYKTVNGQFDALFDALQVTANFSNNTDDILNVSNALMVYPNPSRGVFKIQLNEKAGTIDAVSVFDAMGSKVPSHFEKNTLDLSSLAHGVYYIQVETSNEKTFVKEVVTR